MFVIAEIAGKQYKIEKGDVLKVEKLKANKEGDKLTIDKVLLKSDGKKTEIGSPYLKSSIEVLVKEHGKHDKIKVFKKKAKKRYEKTQGHRQQYTEIEVLNIK